MVKIYGGRNLMVNYSAYQCKNCNKAFMSTSKTPRCTYCNSQSKKHSLIKEDNRPQIISKIVAIFNAEIIGGINYESKER